MAARSRSAGPGAGIGGCEEVRDLVGDVVPAGVGVVERCRVPCLRGLQQLDRDGDVVVQQGGELVTGGRAVVRLDGIADVSLVLQQPLRRGAEAVRSVGV